MTNKEAIHQLEMVAKFCTTTPLAEAAPMGVRTLEQSDGRTVGMNFFLLNYSVLF